MEANEQQQQKTNEQNRTRGKETRNRLAETGGMGGKKGKNLVKEQV